MTSVGSKVLTLLVSLALFVGVSRGALALQVGEPAPDFELESTSGGKLKLSSLRGKNVLLNFYVLDFTPTWIQCLEASGADNYPRFKAEDTEVLGISANTTFSQKAFVDFTKLNYPLLSDREGKVMQLFGVYDAERRLAKRSYVIIDKTGVVRYLNVRPTNTGRDLLSTDELLSEVKKINRR